MAKTNTTTIEAGSLARTFGWGHPSLDDITGPLKPKDWDDIAGDYQRIAGDPETVLTLCKHYNDDDNVRVDAAYYARFTLGLGQPDRYGQTPSNEAVVQEALTALGKAGVNLTMLGLARHAQVIRQARSLTTARAENAKRNEQDRRALTCDCCGRYSPTVSGSGSGGDIAATTADPRKGHLCQPCRAAILVHLGPTSEQVEAWLGKHQQ